MRLAQAARNLSITTDDIVTFLAKKDIIIEKDSNTKLDDNSINLLFEYFDTDIPVKKEDAHQTASIEEVDNKVDSKEHNELQKEELEPLKEDKIGNPDLIQEETEKSNDVKDSKEANELLINEKEVRNDLVQEEPTANEIETLNEDSAPAKASNQKYKTVADLLEDEQAVDEDVVIKAPKVSLQGLNVLGKIDLPEPKPKQEKEEVQKREKKEFNKNRSPKRSAARNTRKELSPQQLREREKKKELRKREEAERKAKKKREAFYKEQILKPKQEQQKKKKPKQKKVTANTENQKPQKPLPKSFLGKFWRWLNT